MAIPVATPVTTPVTGSTVAIDVGALVQVPPDTGSVNVIVDPAHTWLGPEIELGDVFTVTANVLAQPDGIV